jgi:hypothetical protein
MIADFLSASYAARENIEENPSHGQPARPSNPQMTRQELRSLLVEALILTEDSSVVEDNHDDDEPSGE